MNALDNVAIGMTAGKTRSVVFEVEAWHGDRKIGDGTHRRGIVNLLEFEKRFGVKRFAMSLD
jgi:fluoroacetyl-CoA thioesterase